MFQKLSSQKLAYGELTGIRRDPPAILDVRTLSLFLGQSERKTRDDIRFGLIPHIRLVGRVLVRRIDLERSLAAMVRN